MRDEREHADDGPMFGYLKRTHPNAADADIKRAIMEAVRFRTILPISGSDAG